jgi:acyl carrier protein
MKIESIEFNIALAHALDLEPEKVDLNLNLLDTGLMDSLAVVSLVAAVNMHFGVVVKGTELQQCSVVREIYDLIERKIANRQS